MKAKSVSIKTSVKKTRVGKKFVIRGKVRNSPRGTRVILQVKKGSKWKNVATRKTNKAKKYTFNRRANKAGVHKYRVLVKKKGKKSRLKSRTVKVKVIRIAPRPKFPNPGDEDDHTNEPNPDSDFDMENATLETVRAQIISDINAYRAKNGVSPMVHQPGADAFSADLSHQMVLCDCTIPDRNTSLITSPWLLVNTFMNIHYYPDKIVEYWVGKSANFRSYALNAKYTDIAVGFEVGPNGLQYVNFALIRTSY